MFQFEKVSPESLGIPSQSILDFIARSRLHSNELHSLQVLRHGKRCFFGCFPPYRKDTPHIMFSFSKSLTSTAIGFAEQEGLLALDEKLIDIFPDLCPEVISDNLREADIFSLLTMSCGHADEIHAGAGEKDWIRLFLNHEFTFPPRTTFQYNTAGTNVLAAILRMRSGLNVTEYLKPRLFDIIGIPEVECWKLADGTEFGGAGMFLTPDSMARFAQFLLNRGKWEGKQLLRESWFDRACVKQVETVSVVYHTTSSEWMQGYGFQYWMCTPEGAFRADGAYGQFAVIFPRQDAAVILTSACTDTNRFLTDLNETVIASMTDVLPEADAVMQNRLHEAEEMQIPTIWGLRNQEGERALEGVSFRADGKIPAFTVLAGGAGTASADPGHLVSVAFSFRESSVVLSVTQDNTEYRAEASFSGSWSSASICGLPYGLAARWAAADTLVIDTRCIRAATGSRLLFRFDEKGLTLTVNSSYPSGWRLADSSAEGEIRFTRE